MRCACLGGVGAGARGVCQTRTADVVHHRCLLGAGVAHVIVLTARPGLPARSRRPHNAHPPPSSPPKQVILATNIAETSITIAGVRYVVDTGFVKSRSYSPRLGADCLQVRGREGEPARGWGIRRVGRVQCS